MYKSIQEKHENFVKKFSPHTYSSLRLAFYVVCILISHLLASLLYEKIYKTSYIRTNSSTPPQNQQHDKLQNPFATPIFNQFFGFVYGFFMYEIWSSNSGTSDSEHVPAFEFIRISGIQMFHIICLTVFTIQTSFILVNMINSCQLIAVVLISVFCTQASRRYRVQKRQIFIAILLCVGIIVFNYFSQKNSNSQTQTSWIAVIVLLVSLALYSYKPELASRIRQKYRPEASLMYYQISKYLLIFSILCALVSNKLLHLLKFMWQHDRVALDLCIQSLLNMIGSIFIYRVIIDYKQHVVPFIVTVRRLLSSLLSIFYFKNKINSLQYVGMGIVFGAILIEIWLNLKQKQQDQTIENKIQQNYTFIHSKPSNDFN